MLIDCPSGLSFQARKLRGREISQLANQSWSATGNALLDLVRSCWESTNDAGPYAHADSGVPNWNQVVSGDLMYSVVQLAAGSIPRGNMYKFSVQCERKHHGADPSSRQYMWSIDLTKQIEIKKMSADARKALREHGNIFSTTLLTGQSVTFHLLTATDDAPLTKLLREHKLKNATLAERFAVQVDSIDGVKPGERNRYKFFLDAEQDLLEDLRSKIDANDCGMDTSIKTVCQEASCGWVQKVELPFAGLFSPREEIKTEDPSEDPEIELSDDPPPPT